MDGGTLCDRITMAVASEFVHNGAIEYA